MFSRVTGRADDPGGHPLRELALLFLRIGCVAFGGPAAHIAMMEEEVVRRRGWLTREEFLDRLGATNLIPGPNSTEMAIHIGHRRAGWPGLLVAGACFILPATLMVALLAWGYVRHGRLPAVAGILYGLKPVMIAILVQALWLLGRTAVKSAGLAILAAAGLVASLLHVHELAVLLGSGAVAWLARAPRRPAVAAVVPGLAVAGAATASPGVASVFLLFAKIGSVLYGSGYVLIAFLRADLVERLRWLTPGQLLDAVAVGQITPGPVSTTATFVGYLVAGWPGAAAATLGIFLPAFLFVAASGPLVPRLRRSPGASAFLDGVNVASLALMAAVAYPLGRAALVDLPTLALALTAAALLLLARISSVWVVALGALVGLVIGAH